MQKSNRYASVFSLQTLAALTLLMGGACVFVACGGAPLPNESENPASEASDHDESEHARGEGADHDDHDAEEGERLALNDQALANIGIAADDAGTLVLQPSEYRKSFSFQGYVRY